MNFKNLIKRFDLNIKFSYLIELPLFETISLPKYFFDLFKKPYNYDIIDYSVEKCVDLLTGKISVLNDIGEKTYLPSIKEYNKLTYKEGVSMFLCLTGLKSSAILFIKYKKMKVFQKGIYLDKFRDWYYL